MRRMNNQMAVRLKKEFEELEELRSKRIELGFKHEEEMTAIDKKMNLAWAKVSSLVSVLE